jgi:outer membrane protein OmpA-like peptidoglycan-associated protein
MPRRLHRENFDQSLDIFQPFTDLMSNAFMIISFFLLLSLFQALALNKSLEAVSPIIIDERSGTFKFESGEAKLTPELDKHIESDITVKILSIMQQRDIDFIQVIGHTDGESINQNSNLDHQLERTAFGNQPVTVLKAGSNADLGLMRALAVVQALKNNGSLKHLDFRAYSAAQLYLPDGTLAPVERAPNKARRRIEIRFIPPGKEE